MSDLSFVEHLDSAAPAAAPLTQDAWDYFAEHIDEFAVAKAICDYFEACPKDLHREDVSVDVFALYLRAKITLKREAVAFVTAQRAIEAARVESQSFRGFTRRVRSEWNALSVAVKVNSPALYALAAFAVIVWLH